MLGGDIWIWMVGLGLVGAFVGVLMLAVWRGYFLPELGTTGQMVSLILGIAFITAGLVGAGCISFAPAAEVENGIPTAVIWGVSDTEALAHLVPIAGTNGYEVRVTYNTTSNAIEGNTEFVVVNFTIDRDDSNPDPAYTTCEVSHIGTFTALTGADAGDTKDIISLNAQGDYAITWTKNSGGYTTPISETELDTAFPRENDHRSGYCSVNVTINGAAIELMAATGDSSSFTLDIAGTIYNFTVRWNTETT